MSKVSVVYRAAKGDSKVVEWGPHTFFDGVPVEIEHDNDTAHMLDKLKGNRFFELSEMGTVNKSNFDVAKKGEEVDEEVVDDEVVDHGHTRHAQHRTTHVRPKLRRKS